MATETMDSRREHVRSVGVTALAALLGVVAAVASSVIAGDVAPAVAAKNQTAQYAVLVAVLAQLPLYRFTGLYDEDEFGVKLILFVALMTFSMWFITWGIMLQTGVSF